MMNPRPRATALAALASIVLLGAGCTEESVRRDAGPLTGTDGSVVDGGTGDRPDGAANPCGEPCGPVDICGPQGSGNGLDDDCDDDVDEGCVCNYGEARTCFPGPANRLDVGLCTSGTMYCGEFMEWGPCIGAMTRLDEVCNGMDDDCDGTTDNLDGCSAGFTCPGNEEAPPLTTFRLSGDRIYTGPTTTWSWGVTCPEEVDPALCPQPTNPAAKDTEVYFTASGAYRINVSTVLPDGQIIACSWTVYVRGGGLRVEVNWNSMFVPATGTGGTDVDLHLHRWTQNGVDTNFFTGDDCYYENCQPDSYSISWPGHPDSPLDNCSEAAHGGGAQWSSRGTCANPRLDVDTNGTDGACNVGVTNPNDNAFCAPENINVDEPIVGQPYRVLVNYYGSGNPFAPYVGQTNPIVNIYCGGAIRGVFGTDPVRVIGPADSSGFSSGSQNDSWYVADVVFFRGSCGLDCTVYPIEAVARGDGFGPAWKCNYDAATGECIPRP